MWRSVARLLLIVVTAIAEIVRRKQTKREMEDLQREQDAIGGDPAGWIIDHFDGVPGHGADSADPVPTEADNHD